MVAVIIGAGLALIIGLMATFLGIDRDRAFYPTVTFVVASYYALFAVMGASMHSLAVESLLAAPFVAAAAFGFRSSLWIVVAALAGHGLFDLVHVNLISNPGVPHWWPQFCCAYDVAAALYLSYLLRRGTHPSGRA